MTNRYEPTPPQDLRKLREGQKDLGVDSATIIHWVVIPGIIGLISALIIGRIVPSLAHSVLSNHNFAQMGRNISLTLDDDFNSLTEVSVFTNNFVLLMLFGFILGVFIKFSFSDARTK